MFIIRMNQRLELLLTSYAPELRLHSEDPWMPVTVEWFLNQVGLPVVRILLHHRSTGRTMLRRWCKREESSNLKNSG